MKLKKYTTTYKTTWKQALDYRFDFLMELACTFIPVIALVFLWREIYLYNEEIQGYTMVSMLSYILLARFIAIIITPDFLFEVMDEIQSGQIQCYMCRPINYIGYWFAKAMGKQSRKLVSSLIVAIIIFGIFFEQVGLNFTMQSIFCFSVATSFSIILYFEIIMAVSLMSFWFYEISSWYYTLTFLIEFLSGGLLPLDLLPPQMQCICNMLPFQLLIYFPTSILANQLSYSEIIYSLGTQLLWILGINIFLKLLWKKGEKHYELIGG